MRVALIDPVKALAAQVIVFHHMMLYSSMRGPLEEAFPTIVGFLADPARYAVQVFLVIAGFLAFQSLTRRMQPAPGQVLRPMSVHEWMGGLSARYRRLVRPYALAMLVACAALAFVQHIDPVIELTPADPVQVLAHLLLVHDLMDIPALSAGVWYVAIDFQLYALSLALGALALRLGRGHVQATQGWLMGLLAALTVVSLLVVNTTPEMDCYGVFFFGAYGLGMLAAWAVHNRRVGTGMAVAVVLIALAQQILYRERLWITLATVVFLLVAPYVKRLPNWMNNRAGAFFQQSSYALFLVHYPLSILAFTVIDQMFIQSTAENLLAAGSAWLIFMVGAWLLMRAETLVFDRLVPAARTAGSATLNAMAGFRLKWTASNAER